MWYSESDDAFETQEYESDIEVQGRVPRWSETSRFRGHWFLHYSSSSNGKKVRITVTLVFYSIFSVSAFTTMGVCVSRFAFPG